MTNGRLGPVAIASSDSSDGNRKPYTIVTPMQSQNMYKEITKAQTAVRAKVIGSGWDWHVQDAQWAPQFIILTCSNNSCDRGLTL